MVRAGWLSDYTRRKTGCGSDGRVCLVQTLYPTKRPLRLDGHIESFLRAGSIPGLESFDRSTGRRYRAFEGGSPDLRVVMFKAGSEIAGIALGLAQFADPVRHARART